MTEFESLGVIYIVFGERAIEEAKYSARTVKETSGLQVAVFCDSPVESEYFDKVTLIERENQRPKVDYVYESPFECTLYLDSDTRVTSDITDMFQILHRFDVAGAQDYARKSFRWATKIPAYDAIPYCFSEFNGGVLLFRKNERTSRFFGLWREYYRRYFEITQQDQPSLRMALYNSDVRIHTLPPEYNVRNQSSRNQLRRRAINHQKDLHVPRILHWHGLNKRWPLAGLLPKYRAMKF